MEKYIKIAKRENNAKRGYLIVNPLQGKHIPVSPSEAFAVFDELAHTIDGKYLGEKLLFIGFAETATAIGSHVAISRGNFYIQTTREIISDVDFIYFSEEHSHASEQKISKTDLDKILDKIDRIVFVEDEVSTGKTILNIIHRLREIYGKKMRFSVMSILNGMTDSDIEKFSGIDIDFLFLQKIDRTGFEEKTLAFKTPGTYVECDFSDCEYPLFLETGSVDARRLVDSESYKNVCEKLAKKVIETQGITSDQKILVLGTEECMYPAIFVGKKIEEKGNIVRTHSTTRSPICAYLETDYPLRSRYTLASLYSPERITYLYNLDFYDRILILTDAPITEKKGIFSLINALKKFSTDICVVRWVK